MKRKASNLFIKLTAPFKRPTVTPPSARDQPPSPSSSETPLRIPVFVKPVNHITIDNSESSKVMLMQMYEDYYDRFGLNWPKARPYFDKVCNVLHIQKILAFGKGMVYQLSNHL